MLLALALVAANLRFALASVPVLESAIADATGWSSTVIGALTMLPVLCMGAVALFVPRIAAWIGRRHTVALALAIITVALTARLAAAVPGVLHASALLVGIGIALAAGLVPSVVREQLADQVGLATGLWSSAMLAGAAIAGVATVPLAEALGSWQAALASWALPAALALVVWWIVEEAPERGGAARDQPHPLVHLRHLPWRDARAWSLTAYLLANSVIFYTALAWLSPLYVSTGLTPREAGLLFGVFTGVEIGGALVMPWLAERSGRPRAVFAATLVLVIIPLAMLAVAPATTPVVVAAVFGWGLGGGFAMGLALLSRWAADPAASNRLTAMAYSVTYLLAAFGPLLAGAVLDASGSFTIVYLTLALIGIVQFATIPALRNDVIVR